MGLFGFGKRMEKEEKKGCCCGGASVEEVKPEANCCCCGGEKTEAGEPNCCCGNKNTVNSIKVLGAGCKSCHEQYEYMKKAVEELGLGIEVEYITDMEKVMAYSVMSMPAIVVNETVVSMGKVLKSAEVIKLLGKLGF